MNAVLSNASIDPNDMHAHQFHDWLMLQARLLREGKVGKADLVHIAQELEEMGNEVESALVFFSGRRWCTYAKCVMPAT